MRIRTLKPEFWHDERLAGISPFARLLAVALLNFADDEGFFYASPALIRGQLFPYEDDVETIRRAIDELSSIDYISLYKDSMTRPCGRVQTFTKHQRIDRPKPSEIKNRLQLDDDSPTHHRTLVDESPLERKGKEQGTGNREAEGEVEGNSAAAATPQTSPQTISQQAEILRLAYPRQTHLADTLREASAAIRRHGFQPVLDGTRTIAAVVARWSPAEKTNFIKRPDEFFRGDHWADDPTHWLPRSEKNTAGLDTIPGLVGGRTSHSITHVG